MSLGGGFNFGNTASQGAQPATANGGLSLGSGAATGFGASTGMTGFSFGTPQPTSTLTLGAPTTTATLTLGTASNTTTGFSFGSNPTTSSTLTLGAAKPAATLGGFGLATTTSTAPSALKLGGFPKTTTASLGLGGFGTAATSTAPVTTASIGLGGVDPKTATSVGNTGGNGKPSDSKAVKECALPNPVCVTVQDFRKFVKNQKTVRENIARMSSKPLYRVQEEVASLKQLLSIVSTGLQRNAITIENLKKESTQELKHAEMSQRTKDTPMGLQYENVAPTEYFHTLSEKFEAQMILYRQQIEEMESLLASMQNGDALSPQELANLLNKLHDSFVVLAAQLQAVHEAVKAQKEQYLNYRKVFLGDSSNIFEKRKKVEEKTGRKVTVAVGPTPFTGMSNATAIAMASALNRTQQPPAPSSIQPVTGLFGAQPAAATGGLFGSTTAQVNPGTGIFGSSTTAQTGGIFGSKPTGFGTAFPSAAGTPAQSTGFSFATPTAAVRPLG